MTNSPEQRRALVALKFLQDNGKYLSTVYINLTVEELDSLEQMTEDKALWILFDYFSNQVKNGQTEIDNLSVYETLLNLGIERIFLQETLGFPGKGEDEK